MNTISLVSASFVARQLSYAMTGDWGQGDRATNAYFREPEVFAERFDSLLAEVRALGFTAVDLWTAHLNWAWATPEHLRAAGEALRRHGLSVPSFAGGFGKTREEFIAACRTAAAVECDLLAGAAPYLSQNRAEAVAVLRDHGVRFALENHPEKTPEEYLAKLGSGDEDVLGLVPDTGWFGTQGYDAAAALERLAPRVMHVHLKDVSQVGKHDTCRLGKGVVPVRNCVLALRHAGYLGAIGIEHEPEHSDPSEDIKVSLADLREWLQA
jgi:L-ribulose-5-phosphate 3-epimerase